MIRAFLKFWLPVLLWMTIIFSASGDKSSGHRSSRIIGPIVRWLVPNISEQNLETVVFLVRKTAHVTEFAVLALLLFRALARSPGARSVSGAFGASSETASGPKGFPFCRAVLAFVLATLYAITDEFHQTFVPSREGQVIDVLIDASGATLALVALWLFGRWRRWW